MRCRFARVLAGLAVIVTTAVTGTPFRVAAQAPPFRSGDTITIIVPFAPGGGFDTYARLVAPFFEQELQKLSGVWLNVVVTNMAGAGGQTAIERIYRGRPDGRTLAIMSDSVAISQAVLYNAPFDLTQLTYLAQVNRSDQSLMIRVSAFPGVSTFMDMVRRSQAKPVLMGTVG